MKIEIINSKEIVVNGVLFVPAIAKPKPVKVKNEDHPAWEGFLKLWKLYEKKGNKPQAFKNLIALTQVQRNEMYKKVQEYVKSTPDKAFRKGLEVYLNKKKEHWNDLIVQPEPTGYGNKQPAVRPVFQKREITDEDRLIETKRLAELQRQLSN
jgi:hypothetical protein